jgi:Zn finger protein HypA/HybF involved in hydrogenase expression
MMGISRLPIWLEKLPPDGKMGLIVELLLGQGVKYQGVADPNLREFVEVFGIDVKAVEARVRGAKGERPKAKVESKEKSPLAEHDFEKIVGNKYRCRGCGAAAVKQGKELLVERAMRGKACSHSEDPHTKVTKVAKKKPKRKCSHCSNEAERSKSMCPKCLAKNAARAKARRKKNRGARR